MAGFTNFLEDKVLEHIFVTPYTPGSLCIGLCTQDPTDTATGAVCFELADAGDYARATFETADWELAGIAGKVWNKNIIDFPEPTVDWGLVTHFVIVDAITYGTGNVLVYGPITPNVTLLTGSIPQFDPHMMSVLLE